MATVGGFGPTGPAGYSGYMGLTGPTGPTGASGGNPFQQGPPCTMYRAHGFGETWCIHCYHAEEDHIGAELPQAILGGTSLGPTGPTGPPIPEFEPDELPSGAIRPGMKTVPGGDVQWGRKWFFGKGHKHEWVSNQPGTERCIDCGKQKKRKLL